MDNTIDTGDPWDLPDQETAPAAGGINALAEGTGLFGRKAPRDTEQDPADESPDEALPDAALPEGIDVESEPIELADDSIESALQELEAAEAPAAPTPADDVEAVLEELGAVGAEEGEAFELIPPPAADEVSPMYETYSPDLDAPAEEPDAPAAFIPPGPPEAAEDPFAVASAPVAEVDDIPPVPADPPSYEAAEYEPPAPTGDLAEEPVEIEFGAPRVPEGSEQPTGKAAQTASTETMSRPALLTTETVAGANIAPVDMVIAVTSVGSPDEVANAMERVLSELRNRCSEVGGDVVIGLKTEISSAGTSIMVTAAGTAVSLL